MTIKLKFFNYLLVLVCLIMGTGMSMHAEEQTFTRIDSIAELNDGDRFIVVNEKYKAVLTEWNKNKRFNYDSIKIENGIATTNSFVTIFTLENPSPKYYHLKTEANLYLSNASNSSTNYCNLKTTPDVTSRATIEINKTYASIVFKNNVSKALLFSNGAGFSCYGDNFVGVTDKMIAIYKAEGSQSAIKKSTFVTFSSNDLTIYKGKEYSLPTASVTLRNGETIGHAKLSYSSSNKKVASVDESTGEIITLNEFGTTTITAKYAGSDSYKESEGSYTLTYQDRRLGEATIVFSADKNAFSNLPKTVDKTTPAQVCIFKADNGEEYKFNILGFHKNWVDKAFLTSIVSGGRINSPEFLAPNGYDVRVTFEQEYNATRPFISNANSTNYIKNRVGVIGGFYEYEFTEHILDSKPFTIRCDVLCYIKKIEIFINPVPSIEISDTDFEADAKIKEYDQTAVHFKLKRSFVADDTWYTICLPFNVAKEQLVEVFGGKVELRTFDHMKGTVMYFKPVYDLAAGVPYLIKPNKNLDNLLFENVKIDMAAHPDLQVGADGYFMKGTYQATELNPDGTNLFLGDNNTFFRPSENDHRMKGTRVYFIIPRKAVGKVLSYDTETIVDGIVDVEVNSQSNSQKVYNINGVYVGDNLQNLTPGVYIVDGKKVVVTNR